MQESTKEQDFKEKAVLKKSKLYFFYLFLQGGEVLQEMQGEMLGVVFSVDGLNLIVFLMIVSLF